MKSSRWTIVMVGVLAFLMLATMVSASPLPSAPAATAGLNADTVDRLHASRWPRANTLLALNRNKKFPSSVIPAVITRDKEVTRIVKKNDGAGSGLDADRLDGQHGSYYEARPVVGSSYSDQGAYLTASCANYLGGTVTVNAKGAGKVIVEANAGMLLDHPAGATDHLVLGIGTTATDCGNEYDQVHWEIPSSYGGAETIDRTFTVRRIFSVSAAGAYTYYLNGYMYLGYQSNSDQFRYASLQAVFYPD